MHEKSSKDLLNCCICLEYSKSPVICPKCGKIACQSCMKKWLEEYCQACPHCRQSVDINQLVPGSLIAQLQETLTLSESGKEETCSKHGSSLDYYCSTCKCLACSECIICDKLHLGHEVSKSSLVRANYEKQSMPFKATLKKGISDLEQLKKSICINIGNLKHLNSNYEFSSMHQKFNEMILYELDHNNLALEATKSKICSFINKSKFLMSSMDGKKIKISQLIDNQFISKQEEDIKSIHEQVEAFKDEVKEPIFSINPVAKEWNFKISAKQSDSSSILSNDLMFCYSRLSLQLDIKDSYYGFYLKLLEGFLETEKFERHLSSSKYDIVRSFITKVTKDNYWGAGKVTSLSSLNRGFFDNHGKLNVQFMLSPLSLHSVIRIQEKKIKSWQAQVPQQ